VEQNSPAWDAARAGMLTASVAAQIMSADDQDNKDLVKTLAFERAFGVIQETNYQSKAMERGKELEARAREWYEFATDCTDLEACAFRRHPVLPFVSCSPDGLRSDRTVEIKCPLHKAWVDAKRALFSDRTKDKVPSAYRWQARWQMWCCGLRRCDFVVWHPQAGGIIIPYTLTDEDIERMEERAWSIESSVRELHEIISRKNP
jgi:putative phage-type endonuclease